MALRFGIFLLWLITLFVAFRLGGHTNRDSSASASVPEKPAVSVEPVKIAVQATPRTVDPFRGTILQGQAALDELLLNADEAGVKAALEMLLNEEPSNRRNRMLLQVMKRWGAIAPLNALQYSQRQPALVRVLYEQNVLAGWAKRDAKAVWT